VPMHRITVQSDVFQVNFGERHWSRFTASGLPPNKALQLAGHSTFQSIHGNIWHSTGRFEPPGQRAGS